MTLHVLIRHAQQRLDDIARDSLAHDDSSITHRQLMVLQALLKEEPLNQAQLVDRTLIDRSTLSDIVKRLVQRRLITRRRSKEDTRAYIVRLTAAGRDILTKIKPAYEKAVDERVGRFTRNEIDITTRVLQALAKR